MVLLATPYAPSEARGEGFYVGFVLFVGWFAPLPPAAARRPLGETKLVEEELAGDLRGIFLASPPLHSEVDGAAARRSPGLAEPRHSTLCGWRPLSRYRLKFLGRNHSHPP